MCGSQACHELCLTLPLHPPQFPICNMEMAYWCSQHPATLSGIPMKQLEKQKAQKSCQSTHSGFIKMERMLVASAHQRPPVCEGCAWLLTFVSPAILLMTFFKKHLIISIVQMRHMRLREVK